MRKLFDVKYKDGGVEKKASARINEEERADIDSRYFVLLPFWKDDKGREHYDYITRAVLDRRVFGREMEGWRFTSSIINSRLYMFDFWLLGDGTMLCNEPEGNTRQYRMIPGKFDRRKEPRTDAEQTAKMMYDIVKQVYEMDKIGMLAETVGATRVQRLATSLRILGYDSPERVKARMNEDETYFDIRRARSLLENYRDMSYVYREENEAGERSFTVDYDGIPEQNTNEVLTLDNYELTNRQLERDTAFMDEHQEWVTAIRSVPVLGNFLLDMETRIGKTDPEGYKNYCNVSRRIAEIFLGLNPDLVGEKLVGIPDLTVFHGKELEQKISQLIGEEDYKRACEFEDNWFMSECERAAKVIDDTKAKLDDRPDDRLDFITETTLKETARRLQTCREEKAQALEDYDNLRSLYSRQNSGNNRKNVPPASSKVTDEARGEGERDDK